MEVMEFWYDHSDLSACILSNLICIAKHICVKNRGFFGSIFISLSFKNCFTAQMHCADTTILKYEQFMKSQIYLA